MRWLVVNADDFGLSQGVNRGIIEAHERGVVTSASLMVRAPAAAHAAAYARRRPQLGVGLHAVLRGRRKGGLSWLRMRSERKLPAVVAGDLADQLQQFQRLVGRDPTHLDSHHHCHRTEYLRPIFLELAQELNVPLRHFAPDIRFCGSFYGQDGAGRPQPEAITPDALVELLEQLSPGVTELCSHPGYPDRLKSWYRDERNQEVRTLCDPRVHAAIRRLRIRLISFRDLAALRESRVADT